MCEELTKLSPIISWLLIILGWHLVNRQNNIREKRKEIRVLIDKIQTLLDEIEKQAIQYHTNEVSDELSFRLKRDLTKNFQNKLEILKLRRIDIRQCEIFHRKLRQAVTLENFDTAAFQPQTISSDIIRNVWIAKDNLSQELEKCFAKHYEA